MYKKPPANDLSSCLAQLSLDRLTRFIRLLQTDRTSDCLWDKRRSSHVTN